MNNVISLTPGDEVYIMNRSAIFVSQTRHPIWPTLRLVIWRLDDGSWSFDALAANQEIGDITPSTGVQRLERLREALLGGDT